MGPAGVFAHRAGDGNAFCYDEGHRIDGYSNMASTRLPAGCCHLCRLVLVYILVDSGLR